MLFQLLVVCIFKNLHKEQNIFNRTIRCSFTFSNVIKERWSNDLGYLLLFLPVI
jgi:hypothetical protein